MDQPDQVNNGEEIKELIKEDLELNKENNELLKDVVRSTRWGLAFSVIKWVIIIGSIFGIYYYFGQFLSGAIDRINRMVGTSPTATESSSGTSTIQEKIEQLKNAIRKI